MNNKPDETEKPEPTLFDGIADTAPQPPVQQPVATVVLPEVELPAAEPELVIAPAAPLLADAELPVAEPEPVIARAAPLPAEEPGPPSPQSTPSPLANCSTPPCVSAEGVVTSSVLAGSLTDQPPAPSRDVLTLPPAVDPITPEPTFSPSPPVAIVCKPATFPPTPRPEPSTGAWWTIPIICVGLMMVACALIVGQVEVNRQVAWQRNKLKIDLDYLHEQVKQNEEFLKRIQTDPTMAERLAQRQMKQVREGSAILDVRGLPHQNDRNPFQLTTIPPPQPLAPYQPRGDLLTTLFADQQRSLAAIGIGLMLVAAGLVLGGPDEPAELNEQQKAPKAPPTAPPKAR